MRSADRRIRRVAGLLGASFCLWSFQNGGFAAVPGAAEKAAGPAKVEKEQAALGVDLMTGWQGSNPDGSPGKAKFEFSNGLGIVTGTSLEESFGGVHKSVSVDLDRTPYLTLDVSASDGFWYLIVRNERIKDGYARVQQDSNAIGKHGYDLRQITGLKGRQEILIEVGVSSWADQKSNAGKKMSFKEFRMGAQPVGMVPGALRAGPWQDRWPDGKDMDAMIRTQGESFTVLGRAKKVPYGSVRRLVTVNLDKTPILEITPSSLKGLWYLEATGGDLKSPFKIQFDTALTGPQSYDLKRILGLSGERTFELLIGVSADNKEETNAGKEASFKGFRFSAPK